MMDWDTAIFTLYSCNACAGRWAVIYTEDEILLWPIHDVTGDPTKIAGSIACPKCGGTMVVTADLASPAQTGEWLNISLSDPVFVDEAVKN